MKTYLISEEALIRIMIASDRFQKEVWRQASEKLKENMRKDYREALDKMEKAKIIICVTELEQR